MYQGREVPTTSIHFQYIEIIIIFIKIKNLHFCDLGQLLQVSGGPSFLVARSSAISQGA